MTIRFNLTLFRWRIGTFDIDLIVDPATAAAASPVVDGFIKRTSRKWVERMSS